MSRGSSAVQPPEQILLRADEAARMLAMSTRSLWSLTNRREVRSVRVGRSVRYHIDDLKAWAERVRKRAR